MHADAAGVRHTGPWLRQALSTTCISVFCSAHAQQPNTSLSPRHLQGHVLCPHAIHVQAARAKGGCRHKQRHIKAGGDEQFRACGGWVKFTD